MCVRVSVSKHLCAYVCVVCGCIGGHFWVCAYGSVSVYTSPFSVCVCK